MRRPDAALASVKRFDNKVIHAHFAAVQQTAFNFYRRDVLESWSRYPDEARYQQIRQAIAKGHELFLVAEDLSGVVAFGLARLSSGGVNSV